MIELPPPPTPQGGWRMKDNIAQGYCDPACGPPTWVDAGPIQNPWSPLYTVDQMRSYGEACARAAPNP